MSAELVNYRVWSFTCPSSGHIHYAVPTHGPVSTIHRDILAEPGMRELRAIREMDESPMETLAREQFAGG